MKNQALADTIEASSNIVFFGGAGVSTESGIPDFRSESGLYRAREQFGHSPEELLSHHFFVRNPETFFAYYKSNLIHQNARPNAAHIALAEWERQGKLRAIVTQNIDGLHQTAGSQNVLELHGSVHRNYCLDCGKTYGLDVVLRGEGVPRCECGGIVRPDVVLYEEGLDGGVVSRAVKAIAEADVLIIGGTSLAVYPAAGLVNYYRGNKLVLINRDPTPMDARANLVIHGSIGEVLGALA